jgi:hypothetical protein
MGLSIKHDVTQFAPVPYRGQDRRKVSGFSPTAAERRIVVQAHPVMKEGDFHVKGVIESSSTQELSRENSPIDARVISVRRNIGGGIEYEFAITAVPGRRSATGAPPIGIRERRVVRYAGVNRRLKQVARPNQPERRLAPFAYGKGFSAYSGAERRIHPGMAPGGKERRGAGLVGQEELSPRIPTNVTSGPEGNANQLRVAGGFVPGETAPQGRPFGQVENPQAQPSNAFEEHQRLVREQAAGPVA